ncbi:hypothetical protein JOF56_003705 [Kibdelosporangium banguiense]|uniref:Single-stranded DNA-binding protein n=1 Tax=Kibdelosporangium banguiense TaxID=1365924 RepID=A0ABS4TFY1_9PSEU|nr:hypothetical protein [Kibdelosporangium banguiense]MBP2323320.1 hypothetical protein [Kibdelosporangium banguiense]
MPRRIATDGKQLYRAVITTTVTRQGEDPRSRTEVYGPYNRTNEAAALITREKNDAERENFRFGPDGMVTHKHGSPWTERAEEGHVEKATVNWERVGA